VAATVHSSGALPEPSIWTRPVPQPRRRSLGREAIVAAAIQVADEGGVEALTMQSVAHALGAFTPMSLYRYVYGKDGLIDLMLDSVWGEIDVPSKTTVNWRAGVTDLALRTWIVLGRHPWFAHLVPTRPPLGPNALRRTEFLLHTFHALGADLPTAMGYVSLVERLIIGMVVQFTEEARAQADVDFSTSAGAAAALAPLRRLTAATDAYPTLARWAAAPSGPSLDAQFELGLSMLLDGIAARHPGPPIDQ
jgi:AcrR family transcriptional regulator